MPARLRRMSAQELSQDHALAGTAAPVDQNVLHANGGWQTSEIVEPIQYPFRAWIAHPTIGPQLPGDLSIDRQDFGSAGLCLPGLSDSHHVSPG